MSTQTDAKVLPFDPLASRRRMAVRQTDDAIERAELDPDRYLPWPWADVDDLLAPMAPAELHIVTGFSGGGKTTFTLSAIDAWVEQGKSVLVFPLELSHKQWRPMWACFRVGLPAGDVLTGKLKARALRGDAVAKADRDRFLHELDVLGRPPYSERLVIDERSTLTADELHEAFVAAGDMEFDVAVVDTIDHCEGEKGSTYEGARAMARAAHEGVQDGEIIGFLTSQCNNDVVRGGDALARWQPPKPHHVLHGGAKREVCTSMSGIFRPLRGRRPDETVTTDARGRIVDPYLDAMKAARADRIEPHHMLEPNVTGLVCMKSRHYGSHEGRRVFLGYDRGRNVPLTHAQRFALESAQHSIRTSGGL